ncbi:MULTISPECIES: flippase [Myxococcaceae]|uniref:flippase n=1 Tax=Myxococcaceae TaxID=31 RepID=UPI00188E21EB|nr:MULTISPECIES: flippase [Myxococcaceae]MBF5042606.1 flippase [Simulacricoccus sp. 17bor-14]
MRSRGMAPEPMSAAAPPDAAVAVAVAAPAPTNSRVVAARNALKLGASLLGTWAVALVIRIALPRHLGPELFGTLNLADTLAATYFILLTLGVDTYIQKEISVRPAHASDFFGGLLVARALLSAPVFAALALSIGRAGAPAGTEPVVVLFGVAYLCVSVSNSLAALLQAHGTVGRLAVINVGAKLIWAVGVGLGIVLHAPLWVLASSFLLSEALRVVLLWPIAQRELDLTLRVDAAATREVLRACIPFFVNGVAVTLCSKVDVTMLGFLTRDAQEIGWYSASNNLASLAMLLSPLVNWVVMPLLSRARAESHEAFVQVLRRSVAGVITATLPIMLLIGLGADLLVRRVFGEAYAPAVHSLRVLVLLFAFTYLAILLSMALITENRGWTLTSVSITGVILNPLIALVAVPLCARHFGPGGAGVGSAVGVVGMEICVTAMLMWTVGRELLDRSTLLTIGRSLAVCAAVILLHRLLAPLGPWRLAVDALAYLPLAWAFGAVRPRELIHFVREVLGQRAARRAQSA